VARTRSNVERVRRPFTLRHALRVAIVAAGLTAGVVVAWVITPQSDLLAFDTALVRGALVGGLLGLVLAALVPLRERPPLVVHPRPSGFDALRAEMEAERRRAALGDPDAAGGRDAGAGDATDDGRPTVDVG
jgi:hypothetical protein